MVILSDVPARAVAVFAHPDDPEVACAGTLAAWVAGGAEVHLVVVNRGEKGSADPTTDPETLAATRAGEVHEAADVLGLASVEVLGIPDGEAVPTAGLREAVVARIRRLCPEVVVFPDPTAVFFGDSYVNHLDHRGVGWATLDACAPMAGSPLYFPAAGPAHRPDTALLAGSLEPDCWVDITATIDRKAAALACHRSQLGDAGADVLVEVVRGRAEDAARASGDRRVRLAEGFRRLRL